MVIYDCAAPRFTYAVEVDFWVANSCSYNKMFSLTDTYDHRRRSPLGPVRSPHVKPSTGGLVVRWVTTGEYPLLYVFAFFSVFLFVKVLESVSKFDMKLAW